LPELSSTSLISLSNYVGKISKNETILGIWFKGCFYLSTVNSMLYTYWMVDVVPVFYFENGSTYTLNNSPFSANK
jgi:hypothetical protein